MERLIGWVLRLSGPGFRERYREELLAVHRERWRERRGAWGRLSFVVREVGSAVRVVWRTRVAERRAGGAASSAGGGVAARGGGVLTGWRGNVRLALRTLVRRPGYAWMVVGVLSLGIGGATGVFAAANAYLFRPLPFPEGDRLVTVYETNPQIGWTAEDGVTAAPANALDWRERVGAFDDVALFSDFVDGLIYAGDGGEGEATVVNAVLVTGNFFDVLAVRPALGRSFRWEETWGGGAEATPLVLSHGLWQRLFGGDPAVLGRVLDLGGNRGRVIGVMPAGFRFPSDGVELWAPFGWSRESREQVWFRRAHFVRPVIRLAPGVDPARAAAELQTVVARLQQEYPETNEVMGAVLVPLRKHLTRSVERPLWLLLGAAGLLLLLACVNASTLALVRAGDRGWEVAVRRALGAGRARVAALVWAEHGVLGLLGGVGGMALALLAVAGISRLTSLGIDGATDVVVDHRVALVLLASVVLAAGVSGAVALTQSLVPLPVEGLRGDARAGRRGPGRLRGARVLVAAEVAMAVLLLVGAGLMVRTAWELRDVDPGFETRGVTTALLSLPSSRYEGRDRVIGFHDRLIAALEARPEIAHAGIVGNLPLAGPGWSSQFRARGWPAEKVGWDIVHRRADAGYFEALDIPLVRGRPFTDEDRAGGPPVALVNETLAEEFFPGEDPIGQYITYDREATPESTWREIVGIVGDQHQVAPGVPVRPEAFEHRTQDWARDVWLVVRSAGDGDTPPPVSTLRAVVAELDPGLPLQKVRPLGEVWRASMARETLILLLLGGFAGVALLLAAAGIYGVTSQLVRRRTREIGIRIALGAATRSVLGMVLRQGLVGVAFGVAGGMLAALGATRLMASILYGVEPTDPATLAGVAVLLGGVALLASWIPARRAARTDPVRSLRVE